MTAPHERPVRHSLTARLLWLTIGAVLITEALVFLPTLGRARRTWLAAHVMQGTVAALSVSEAAGSPLRAPTRDGLLHLAGAEMIRLVQPNGTEVTLAAGPEVTPDARLELHRESMLASMGLACADLFDSSDARLLIRQPSAWDPKATIEIVVRQAALTHDLRVLASRSVGLALLIAGVLSVLVYLSLLGSLVRPIRRITDSIAAFRADPERSAPLDTTPGSGMPENEIARAGYELAAMQRELRTALWRNARLAALGTAVAKVSHDLRGILSPALLAADRLQASADPQARRAGEVVALSVQRATDLVRGALDFARDGPPPPALVRITLTRLVQDVIDAVQPTAPALAIEQRIAPDTQVAVDPEQLYRVLSNLLRNAAEAGATRAFVSATIADATGAILIDVGDNGPGLQQAVQKNLFRPFNASGRPGSLGLGLAIARDLMRAHGGDATLLSTGPAGTVFRLTLPAVEWQGMVATQDR